MSTPLEGEHALLSGDTGELDRLLDELLRGHRLVQEGARGHLERAEQLGERDLAQRHHEGAADDDREAGGVEEGTGAATD